MTLFQKLPGYNFIPPADVANKNSVCKLLWLWRPLFLIPLMASHLCLHPLLLLLVASSFLGRTHGEIRQVDSVLDPLYSVFGNHLLSHRYQPSTSEYHGSCVEICCSNTQWVPLWRPVPHGFIWLYVAEMCMHSLTISSHELCRLWYLSFSRNGPFPKSSFKCYRGGTSQLPFAFVVMLRTVSTAVLQISSSKENAANLAPS